MTNTNDQAYRCLLCGGCAYGYELKYPCPGNAEKAHKWHLIDGTCRPVEPSQEAVEAGTVKDWFYNLEHPPVHGEYVCDKCSRALPEYPGDYEMRKHYEGRCEETASEAYARNYRQRVGTEPPSMTIPFTGEAQMKTELQLLVVDLGDSCVIQIENSVYPDIQTALKGLNVKWPRRTVDPFVIEHTFAEVKAAIDALEGDKPVPRIESPTDGNYTVYVGNVVKPYSFDVAAEVIWA